MRKTVTCGVLLLLVLATVLGGCSGDSIELPGVEVREYEGERLDSINDFRENSIHGPQYISTQDYRLGITGLVASDKVYTYDEVINEHQSYMKVTTLSCVEGWYVKILWEGVLMRDLLDEAGVLPEASIVIFYAEDGYTTSLPLDYIVNNNIMIAYRMNGLTLPPERGYPFALVAESKWGYKWIKWIVAMELSDDVNYRGFWESRGYSNTAEVGEDFFE